MLNKILIAIVVIVLIAGGLYFAYEARKDSGDKPQQNRSEDTLRGTGSPTKSTPSAPAETPTGTLPE